ncbi:MAG: hypothetical protein ACOYJ1_09070 [Peptococcales bacterium]|jgi:hypothetical protein
MPDLRMEIILLENGDFKSQHDADILAQFLCSLKERYPEITIRKYDNETIEKLTNYVDLDAYLKESPIIILNGHIISSKGIPDIQTVTNYIEEVL